ncbi:hypothetical protein B484DRAFT_260189, partial [Ochromonadaceae sp. CCMP2298]
WLLWAAACTAVYNRPCSIRQRGRLTFAWKESYTGAERGFDSAEAAAMDPVAKRIGRLRALLFGALTVTAVLYGLVVYYITSTAQQKYAGKEFKYLVSQAGKDIRKSFAQSAKALEYLAERYATTFPDESEWPTVMLPGFIGDAPYLRDTTGFESLLFMPFIRFEDVARAETFVVNAWSSDPDVPPSALPWAGFYGVDSTNTAYRNTTREVDWDAKYEVVVPVVQMLFDREDSLPAFVLGRDLHSAAGYGLGIEDIMRCSAANNYTYAREHCGRVSKIEYIDIEDAMFNGRKVVHSNFGVPIMLNHNSSQLVGMVAGHFQWGKSITGLIPDHVSGIDIVLRTQGEVLTFSFENGQAIYQGPGDMHGDKFDEFKYVVTDIVVSGSDTFTLEFYLQQDFMDQRTDYAPVWLAVGAGLQILLCALLFSLYAIPMRALRKSILRAEIVLDTKRRFVRFVSHEIRTPMNAVRLGMTLFSTEIDGLGAKLVGKSLEEVTAVLQETVADWRQIAVDVLDSTEAAVDVLNDLLNYDKV